MRPLVVLGATGSIGTQTLDVAHHLGMEVAAIASRRGSAELLRLAESLPGARVAVTSPTADERRTFRSRLGDRVTFGADSLEALAAIEGAVVVNGIVGAAGLPASLAALRAGNRLALANKESLVAGGPLVDAARSEGGGEIVPVDSEHSALAQCLAGEDPVTIRRIILTASGGPFLGCTREALQSVTVEDALAHPTWNMGPRITIDSATLMNKAFEVIEAHYLFGVGYDAIDVVVHPQSIVHSLVEFVDGSMKAQLGEPDMRGPIQYALTYPARSPAPVKPFDLTRVDLTFAAPDRTAFPCLDLGYEAGRRGGSAPAALNAADEVAVRAFLERRLGFASIAVVAEETLRRVPWRELHSVADVIEVDRQARATAADVIGSSC